MVELGSLRSLGAEAENLSKLPYPGLPHQSEGPNPGGATRPRSVAKPRLLGVLPSFTLTTSWLHLLMDSTSLPECVRWMGNIGMVMSSQAPEASIVHFSLKSSEVLRRLSPPCMSSPGLRNRTKASNTPAGKSSPSVAIVIHSCLSGSLVPQLRKDE